jgi:hypothetical protein
METWGSVNAALTYLTYWRHLDKHGLMPDTPGINEGTQRKVRRALGLMDTDYIDVKCFERTGEEHNGIE